MEGYLRLRIAPWIRRLLTRMIAIIPALITIFYFGEAATGKLLILSQVILSLQLGFAVIPLIHFVSDKSKMKEFVIPVYVRIAAWLSAIIIVGLNARLVYGQINDWLQSTEHPMVLWLTVVPIAGIACLLLLYITFRPLFKKIKHAKTQVPHLEAKDLVLTEPKPYRRIAVAVDFSKMDQLNISNAINQGGKKASYLLLHVVESAGALMMKQDIQDFEFRSDQKNMEKYVQDLKTKGYDASLKIGYGNPKKAIPELVNQFGADLLVMGAHGHRGFKDMILGTTVDVVRHRVHIPVLIVREENN